MQDPGSGQWGTVCSTGWDALDASVACRQLGFSPTDAVPRLNAYFGQGAGAVILGGANCRGTEATLVACEHEPLYGSSCGHAQDAGVSCTPNVDGQLQLAGGANKFQGRVEVWYANAWNTVCDDSWAAVDATVVCRQLGFATAGAKAITKSSDARSYYQPGTGRILLDQVGCVGTEARLLGCAANALFDSDCDHTEDAGVVCLDPDACCACT
jgi:deleted-in-malignant-brain-tumors protein 1